MIANAIVACGYDAQFIYCWLWIGSPREHAWCIHILRSIYCAGTRWTFQRLGVPCHSRPSKPQHCQGCRRFIIVIFWRWFHLLVMVTRELKYDLDLDSCWCWAYICGSQRLVSVFVRDLHAYSDAWEHRICNPLGAELSHSTQHDHSLWEETWKAINDTLGTTRSSWPCQGW